MAHFWNEIYEEPRSDSDSFDSIAYDLHVLKTRLLGFQAEVDILNQFTRRGIEYFDWLILSLLFPILTQFCLDYMQCLGK